MTDQSPSRALGMLLSLGVFFGSTHAHADEAGDAWLARIDETSRVSDAHLVLDITVEDSRNGPQKRTLEIWQRGDDQRLVRLTAPQRLAGVGLLVTHGDVLHLFLPAYPPARRVTGSGRGDAFLGTDFALEDLSRLRYASAYSAVVGGTEGDLTRLDLTPNDGKGAVRLWVGADAVVRRIEHDDRKGRTVRRLELGDIRPVGGVPLAHQLSVTDLVRERKTSAVIRAATVGEGVDEERFTVTWLERP